MSHISFIRILAIISFIITGASAWQSDNGDGTYTNPVLYADYSDPDIIRVGSDFYMVSSTFVASPGIVLLHSSDMVNWEFTAHVASTVDGGDAFDMQNGTAYESGFWAPSIRYCNGTFYVAVQPTFSNGRLYYADNPAGPWNFHQLDRNIYDPGLFFDDDGTGYIISGHGPQSVIKLNSTYSAVESEQGGIVDSGGEGSHLLKRGGYYYLFNANPGVWPFQLRCSRATNIYGPWETGHICLTATTGGHQGAIVDINDNDNWFGFVHQDSGAIGRMPRIGPVFWENNWPVFGTTANRDIIADTCAKPVLGHALMQPATSDSFSANQLGLQWQWNHNPDNSRWSLTDRTGFLRLRPLQADGFWTARNTLTQKAQGPKSHGIVKLDITAMAPGDVAGFGTLGKVNAHIAVTVGGSGRKTLVANVIKDKIGNYVAASDVPVTANTIYLRTDLDFKKSVGVCSYSWDSVNWINLSGQFQILFGYGSTFQGEQYAVFSYNPNTSQSLGYVDVDSFTLGDDAPLITAGRGRPRLNGKTFLADNGQLIRGPYESTEWTSAAPRSSVEAARDLGFNAIHLYAECFDPDYPATGSTAPGYAAAEVDKIVAYTRELGMYVVMTIGNGAWNGDHNIDWVSDFWSFYALRYADETHVIYEIQNEPVAWGPSYSSSSATPTGAIDMEAAAYNIIRAAAPETPILFFTYAVLGDDGGANAALTDIAALNSAIGQSSSEIWSNAAIGFHGYAGHQATPVAVKRLQDAGYACFMTEFAGSEWGGSANGLDVELAQSLEELGISWLTFQYIPPSGVSDDVTVAEHYEDFVNKSGLSWVPDYGEWPVLQKPYTSDGAPLQTAGLSGTLRIQAEDFNSGPRNVSYADNDADNLGGQYRPNEAVDIRHTETSSTIFYISDTNAGEWTEYTLYITEPGYYDLDIRAAGQAGGAVRFIANERDVTGSWLLHATAATEDWQTSSKSVFLEYGMQKLRVEVVSGGFNWNWFQLTASAAGELPDGTYSIVNRASALAMADSGESDVVLDSYTGSSEQLWNFEHLGASQYKVTSAADGDSWSVWGGMNNGIDLVWWWGIDGRHQRYVVRRTEGGYYRIAPVALGLDFGEDGSNVAQQYFTGSASQQWALVSAGGGILFPTNLTARWTSWAQVNLTWNPVEGAEGYNVKRALTSGGPYETIADAADAFYVDASVEHGGRYYYVVSALAGGAESLNSNEATPPNPHTHLKFDESGGSLAFDRSDNGLDGTLYGGALRSAGKFGNAVLLDGSDDYVSLPEGAVSGLSEFTIALWVYLDSVSTWSRVFDFGTGTTVNMFFTPRDGSGKARFSITTGGSWSEQQISAGSALSAGVWTHIAVTISDGVGVLYINGAEEGRNSSMTLTPASLGNTTQNYLGKSQYSADALLDGRLDELRIYPTALDAPDVALLFAEQVSVEPQAPSRLTATASDGLVLLDWDDNAESDLAGYFVYRSAVSGGDFELLNEAALTASEFADESVSNGTTYYYVVAAVNTSGESSEPSEQAAARPEQVSAGVLSSLDFESGLGDWTNITAGDTNDWLRNTGSTLTPSTGPAGGAGGSDWYAYLETSPGAAYSAGASAVLESPLISGYARELSFCYHMYGASIGSLNVDVYDGSWHEAFWSLSGPQQSAATDEYITAAVDLRGFSGDIVIRLRTVAAGGTQGDIAIDNIVVTGEPVYGDFTGDGAVNGADLPVLAENWLAENCSLDVDGDCTVTLREYAGFAGNWLD
jgi:beta-xylosidase/fibronectin type 3 domain-containing protein